MRQHEVIDQFMDFEFRDKAATSMVKPWRQGGLLSIMMPDMEGSQVAEEIKKDC